jgi:MYXO-CTERM domain-containing protein
MEFQMRNKTFISSMVGVAAAVAVAGSANAGVVDPFTTAATFGGNTAVWTSITDSLFAQRQAQNFGSSGGATASLSGGSWSFTLSGSEIPRSLLNYRMNGSGGTVDLSGVASMSLDFSAVTGSLFFSWTFVDSNANEAAGFDGNVTIGSSTRTFDMSTAETDPGFDWSNVTSMRLRAERNPTVGNPSAAGTVSNFNFTAVPAPGALALLGVAGLAGGRRRRA